MNTVVVLDVLYEQLLEKKNKLNCIVSKKRIMQSLHFDFAKEKLDQEKLKIFDFFAY